MSGDGNSARRDAIQSILSGLFQAQATQAPGEGDTTLDLSAVTLSDLRALLAARAMVDEDDDDEDYAEDDEDEAPLYYWPQARPDRQQQWFPPHEEPQEAGVRLLNSGDFGYISPKLKSNTNWSNVSRSILTSPYRPVSYTLPAEDVTTNLVPNTNGTTVATYDANIYTAQFSADSSFYYTCAQDFRMHIFDMKKSPKKFGPTASQRTHYGRHHFGLNSSLPLRKEIKGEAGNWTITDANLSPDNSKIIYSSIMSTVYMTSTSPEGSDEQIPIPFADSRGGFYRDNFGIWSCRFSADGHEVVAGGSGHIFVYDLLANRRTVKIAAHSDDVNSCCWADTASGNVLISASDDTFLKVWDRRSLASSQKPSGVLIGHTEGITYVSAKGDGRYVISNGKDQALRLWDLRMMRSSKEHEDVQRLHYGVRNFDYRRSTYPKPRYASHPKDCSVMTYRGHSVLRTLIRCHFSPAETTGSQYLYSGSADGRVHIWSLDGRVVQVLDRSKTLPSSFNPSDPEFTELQSARETNCVRDVSWHSQEPVLMSAAWMSRDRGTSIARHEWKGLSKMRHRLEDWLEKERQEALEAEVGSREPGGQGRSKHRGGRYIPGAYEEDEDDSDEDDD